METYKFNFRTVWNITLAIIILLCVSTQASQDLNEEQNKNPIIKIPLNPQEEKKEEGKIEEEKSKSKVNKGGYVGEVVIKDISPLSNNTLTINKNKSGKSCSIF